MKSQEINRQIVVHMDTEQHDVDSSNETGSFEKALSNVSIDSFNQNDEVFDFQTDYLSLGDRSIAPRPVSPNPISQKDYQVWNSTFCNRIPSEEDNFIPPQEIPRGSKLSRVIPEGPFAQKDDCFGETNQLSAAGDDHSVLINLGPGSRSSTFNDKEEIISPSSDINPEFAAGVLEPSLTSSWRERFTSDQVESFETVLENKTATQVWAPEGSSETPEVVDSGVGKTHNSGWFHSTIDAGSSDNETDEETSEPSVVEHECAPRLSIPYNPIPQDSMEIYSNDYPDIIHEPICAYYPAGDSLTEESTKETVDLKLTDENDEEIDVDDNSERSDSPHSVKSVYRYVHQENEVLIPPSPGPDELSQSSDVKGNTSEAFGENETIFALVDSAFKIDEDSFSFSGQVRVSIGLSLKGN